MNLDLQSESGGLGCEYGPPGRRQCREPATWRNRCIPWSERLNDPPRVLCDHHAAVARRAELDSELRAMGARIIRVKDLGAALEAREKGGQAITLCRGTVAAPAARVFARHAASLARLALGEVGS